MTIHRNLDFKNIDTQASLADEGRPAMMSASQLADRTLERRDALDQGIDLPWGKLKDFFRFRAGELVLLGGYTGHFKSTISSQIGAYAMQQKLGKKNVKVGVCSLELRAEDIIEQFAEISATSSRPPEQYMRSWCDWADDKLEIYDRLDVIEAPDAIRLAILFAKLGCNLIILDCLMMMGVCDDLEREREFIQTLVRVAKKYGVTILLVHHMRKPQGTMGEESAPGKYSFNGSSHISNTPDSILIVHHDKKQAALRAKVEDMNVPDDAYNPDLRDMVLSVQKQRNGKFEGSISLWQTRNSRAFVDNKHRRIERFYPEGYKPSNVRNFK